MIATGDVSNKTQRLGSELACGVVSDSHKVAAKPSMKMHMRLVVRLTGSGTLSCLSLTCQEGLPLAA